MSQSPIIQDFMLNDKRIIYTKIDHDPKLPVFHLYGRLSYSISTCLHCHSRGTMVKNGFKTVYIRLNPIDNRPAILVLRKQRYLCKACRKTRLAQTSLVRFHHQISNPLRYNIIQKLSYDIPVNTIAQQLNVSDVSINRVVSDLHSLAVGDDSLPENISFDEVRLVHHQLSFIMVNAKTSEPLLLLPDRKIKHIMNYFFGHYSLTARQKVKNVVIDFNANYRRLIHPLFPNAKIVGDRYHMVQMLQRTITQNRVNLMHQYPLQSREYRLLKFNWRLYLKRHSDLEPTHKQWFPHLKDRLTQEQHVTEGLQLSPQFEETYNLVQQLRDAIRNKDVQTFLTIIKSKQPSDKGLATVFRTFLKYQDAVSEGIKSQYSNGRIEGINHKIKQVSRTGYGYRNWTHLRNRIFIEFKINVKKRRPIRQ